RRSFTDEAKALSGVRKGAVLLTNLKFEAL
ncbi:MAG: hypothetical protein QG625_979, partial [Cyanobacteriota bacterium erpe_2018_sw_39hr_WHONDRS-SW48-000098_B_bin.30]|nr:hypothetical protein [Cyanobacteriota bacterium erpe_2018_sw_39hr_WHONDRS-SW48-000098_B_bin.30]